MRCAFDARKSLYTYKISILSHRYHISPHWHIRVITVDRPASDTNRLGSASSSLRNKWCRFDRFSFFYSAKLRIFPTLDNFICISYAFDQQKTKILIKIRNQSVGQYEMDQDHIFSNDTNTHTRKEKATTPQAGWFIYIEAELRTLSWNAVAKLILCIQVWTGHESTLPLPTNKLHETGRLNRYVA